MQDNIHKENVRLNVLQGKKCYNEVEKFSIPCQRKSCKQWIDFKEGNNCVVISAKNGPLTLNEIGKIFGLTRMRICQIEKNIYHKIRKFIEQSASF